jgi:hypothetical protein
MQEHTGDAMMSRSAWSILGHSTGYPPPQVTCANNELKGFAGVFIEPTTGTFTATLN